MSDPKERYYSDSEVVRNYEQRRFGRGAGRFVAQKEEATIAGLIASLNLKAGACALDCPTGTGRLLPLLLSQGLAPIAADISQAMLDSASRFNLARCLLASASALPLADDSVELWLMSRFAFHFADLRPFFKEAARVLVPGGHLLFDIYHWTPRQWIPGNQSFLGGRTHTHRMATLELWLKACGFELVARTPTFLLAPYLYGFMPGFLPAFLESISDSLAPRWKTKSYLLARKTPGPVS